MYTKDAIRFSLSGADILNPRKWSPSLIPISLERITVHADPERHCGNKLPELGVADHPAIERIREASLTDGHSAMTSSCNRSSLIFGFNTVAVNRGDPECP